MKIVVTANGASLDAPASPVFGRCPSYVFVDPDTLEFEVVENPAMAAGGGAGIQAAQFVIEQGARAVVTGNVGPNAFNVFQSAGVPVYVGQEGTVRDAVEAFKGNRLREVGGATSPAHAGMGRGAGRGMGMGRRVSQVSTPPTASPSPASARSREEELAELKEMAGDLRSQLAQVMDRLDQLEERG
ncbi:MAG: NifB/NifX family molybdenum-iron cluster-binding protein [Anaerolineae bacterium]|jgi:predicted Fe-Mo cluster-binding NifX family protein